MSKRNIFWLALGAGLFFGVLVALAFVGGVYP